MGGEIAYFMSSFQTKNDGKVPLVFQFLKEIMYSNLSPSVQIVTRRVVVIMKSRRIILRITEDRSLSFGLWVVSIWSLGASWHFSYLRKIIYSVDTSALSTGQLVNWCTAHPLTFFQCTIQTFFFSIRSSASITSLLFFALLINSGSLSTIVILSLPRVFHVIVQQHNF